MVVVGNSGEGKHGVFGAGSKVAHYAEFFKFFLQCGRTAEASDNAIKGLRGIEPGMKLSVKVIAKMGFEFVNIGGGKTGVEKPVSPCGNGFLKVKHNLTRSIAAGRSPFNTGRQPDSKSRGRDKSPKNSDEQLGHVKFAPWQDHEKESCPPQHEQTAARANHEARSFGRQEGKSAIAKPPAPR